MSPIFLFFFTLYFIFTMKKLALLFILAVGVLGSYAQDAPTPLFDKKSGGGFIKKGANTDNAVQDFVKKGGTPAPSDSKQGTVNEVENKTPECETNHTGEVLFFNNTGKPITLEVMPKDGGNVKGSIVLAANQSSFVNDLGIGMYKYKSPNAKKYKKQAIILVRECTMKIVHLN